MYHGKLQILRVTALILITVILGLDSASAQAAAKIGFSPSEISLNSGESKLVQIVVTD